MPQLDYLTKHALERMKQRAITKDEVIQAISTSKDEMTDSFGHSIAHVDSNGKILRVFFIRQDDNIVIITAYKTSKEKYRRM